MKYLWLGTTWWLSGWFLLLPSVADAAILYEQNFATDPGWQTDMPENVTHDAQAEVLRLRIPTQPTSTVAERYAVIPIDTLSATSSFIIRWRQNVESVTTGAVVHFGLYSPDLIAFNRTRSNLPLILSDGTVNAQTMQLRGGLSLNYANLIVGSNNYSVGGTTFPLRTNEWYQGEIIYDHTAQTVSYSLIAEESGEEYLRHTLAFPDVFPANMNLLGVVTHPSGLNGTALGITRYTEAEATVILDDVIIAQGTTTEPVTPPEPEGASSVLFLPGIQASRLYTDSFLGEDRLWEPNDNGDVRQLALDENGNSINDVYTSDVLDEIFGVDNVYLEFINLMNELVGDGVINGWTPFPYDWRQSVFDVVENGTPYPEGKRYPIDVVEALAADSRSGKVSIIAHSNGGLLAKALISELESQGKADLIDELIMIGTPQLGTPKLLAAALHGYDQEQVNGLLIDDGIARDVIRNMPGAYGLLPSETYFDSRNDIVIGFDASDTTASFREEYGNAVTYDELTNFLLGSDGRGRATTVFEAEILNSTLLTQANAERLLLDAWQPPDGVEVYEIVGVGVDTLTGFEYQEFPTWRCGIVGCGRGLDIYKPIPYLSEYGDETVVANSAEGGESDATYYVDLNGLDEEGSEFRTHKDLTDSTPVKNLVQVLLGDVPVISLPFVSIEQPIYATKRSLLSTHSPVHFYVQDTAGRRTGRVTLDEVREDIPDSQYFELGGSHFVVVPDGIEYTVVIFGEDEGGMTFRAAELDGEVQTETTRVNVATTTASTTITFAYRNDAFTDLRVDVEGDGLLDYLVTTTGEVMVVQATYQSLLDHIFALDVDQAYQEPLIGLSKLAQGFQSRPGVYMDRIEKRLLQKLLILINHFEQYVTADFSEVIATIKILQSYE